MQLYSVHIVTSSSHWAAASTAGGGALHNLKEPALYSFLLPLWFDFVLYQYTRYWNSNTIVHILLQGMPFLTWWWLHLFAVRTEVPGLSNNNQTYVPSSSSSPLWSDWSRGILINNQIYALQAPTWQDANKEDTGPDLGRWFSVHQLWKSVFEIRRGIERIKLLNLFISYKSLCHGTIGLVEV